MFFPIAKALWILGQPLNVAIILGTLGLLLIWAGRRRLGFSAAWFAVLLLALCTFTNFGAMLIQPLEQRYPRLEPPERIAGIIVLGGGLEGSINRVRGGYEMNSAGDRFIEAASLARRYPDARIVVSGGTGTSALQGVGDAETAPRLFGALGIPAERLILENDSRDTYENALRTSKLIQPKLGETWLLVTSAFHMPRSLGLFRKAGFNVSPWPTDFRSTGKETFGLSRLSPVDSLDTATMAIREWVGLLTYRLAGRTDDLLP